MLAHPSSHPLRPLTARELARFAGYLAAGQSLHPTQQHALLAEVLRLRALLQAPAHGRPPSSAGSAPA